MNAITALRSNCVTRLPDCQILEDRILLSATPMGAMDDITVAADLTDQSAMPTHLFAPMSGTEAVTDLTGLQAVPIPVLIISEDPNDYYLNVGDYFEIDGNENPSDVTYELLSNTNEALFDRIRIDPITHEMLVDFADDAFGDAVLTLRAVDSTGTVVDNYFEIHVTPHNDRPTTTGFANINVVQGTQSTVIDLFAAFDDVEDADHLLTYEVVQLSNPNLFDSVTIDPIAGTLTLDYAAGAVGHSHITLRATDTEGLSVEMSTAGSDFQVTGHFGSHSAGAPNLAAMGVERYTLLTSYAFFDYVPGVGYDYSHFSYNRLQQALAAIPVGYDLPVVLNIELHSYDNSPEGRDNLATVLDAAHSIRPDLDFGYYRLLPERNWHASVGYQRALDEIAAGNLNGWYARQFNTGANYQGQYLNWLARNELYRTEQVSSSLGGGTVADRVDLVYPSLFTPYAPNLDLWSDPNVLDWDVYADYNIIEARKYDVPTKAFISPSLIGTGQTFLPKDFFRFQLDTLFEMTDGILIFAAAGQNPFTHQNSGWVEALEEFMQYIRTPTEFMVSVQPTSAPTAVPTPSQILNPHTPVGFIDLWSAFNDPNHPDQLLDFTVLDVDREYNLADWSIDSGTGRLNFHFNNQVNGFTEFVVRATDPTGWIADNTFRISLGTLEPGGAQIVYGFELNEDTSLNLPSGSLPGLSQLVLGPAHAANFNLGSNGALSYTPQADWFGQDAVQYQATDNAHPGANRLVDIQFIVHNINDAPIGISGVEYQVSTGINSLVLDLTTIFTDSDDDLLQLDYQLLGVSGNIINTYMQMDGRNSVLFIQFVAGAVGTAEIGVQATDPSGATGSTTFSIVRASTSVTAPTQSLVLHPPMSLQETANEPMFDVSADEDQRSTPPLFDRTSTPYTSPYRFEGEDDDDELVVIPLLSLVG